MSKNTNLSFLTDFLTADIVNSRVGMNNASPQNTFDVTGTGKFSGVLTLGSTVSNGTYTYTLPSATGTLALVGGSGVGTVTSVAAITLGTSGTDLTSTVANGTTTPVITLNVPDASVTARGVITTGTQYIAGLKIFTSTIVANVDLQLPAAGTASTTFIKNISGSGLTSIGSNGFGFNNSDNIYFSGSNKAGGVFAFNNTGNRTYTLQDASGTLAFTSQIPTNAVGGTGTLNTIPKFTAATTIGNSNIFDSGSIIYNTNPTAGQFAWQFNGSTITGQSYGAQVIAGTNASDIGFKVMNAAASINYLVVRGDGLVTLTGALNGTSATFTGAATFSGLNLTLNNTGATGSDPLLTIQSLGGGNPRLKFLGQAGVINRGAVGDSLFFGEASDTGQYIFRGTGAATFSSSVGVGAAPTGTYGTLSVSGGISIKNDNSAKLEIGRYSVGVPNSYIKLGPSSNSLIVTNNTDAADIFTILNGGNVGIGTTNPSYPLHISVFDGSFALTGTRGTGTTHLWYTSGVNNQNLIFNNPNGDSYFYSNGNTVLSLTTNRYVGIGLNGPSTKLHIVDNFDADDALGYLLVENTNTTSGAAATNASSNVKNYHGTSQFMQWQSFGLRMGSRILTNGGVGDVYLTAGADSVAMVLKAGGNVLINTTTDNGNKFQVDGNSYINGDTFTNGRFALPFGSVRTYSATGNITINVGNLETLTGNNWRQISLMIFCTGVGDGLEFSYQNVVFVRIRGLSSWNGMDVFDIFGGASISLSNNTTTGFRLTLNVNAAARGSAMVMLASGTSAGQLF